MFMQTAICIEADCQVLVVTCYSLAGSSTQPVGQ